ncbi:MAG: GAF domain-containing protein [Chloroflexi bacterium]|nr:GAF domain-containing protein [Chloroflexota bacterium]
MILTRKILGPALIVFSVMLAGLLGYFYSSYQEPFRREEQVYLSTLNEAFGSEVENRQKTALSLAQEMGNNPQIQEAYASQDRARLLQVAQPFLERMRSFDVTEIQFQSPPATTFLRVGAPDDFGDDLSGIRPLVVDVNTNQQPAVGFEVTQIGFTVSAAVPVFHEGRFLGSLEVDIDGGLSLLDHLVEKFGNDWHISLRQEAILQANPDLLSTLRNSPIEELFLFASTTSAPVLNTADVYRRALNGESSASALVDNNRNYTIFTRPLADYSGRNVGTLDIVVDRTDVIATQTNRFVVTAIAGLAALLIGGLGITITTTRALQPIQSLTTAARELSSGNFSVQIEPSSSDEIGQLATTFSTMAVQLQESITSLEQRIAERTGDLERRTTDLEAISEVVREVFIIRDMATLENVAVNLIRERFGFYHVGLYLLDERGENAFLQAASGAGSTQMVDEGVKWKVSELGTAANSLIGDQVFIARNSLVGAGWMNQSWLPESQKQIVLPLRVQNRNIGALNIHSMRSSSFDEQDVRTLRLLADQLAVAIENTRLASQVESTLGQLNRTYRAQTQEAWRVTTEQIGPFSYEYDGRQVRPAALDLPRKLTEKLASGSVVLLHNETSETKSNGTGILLVPLTVLNQLIGVIGVEQQDSSHTWTQEEISLAETIAARTALTLENARLLEESRRRAAKEQTISEATSRISSALTVENILESTINELERVLGNSDITLQINTGDTSARSGKQQGA